MPPQQAKKQLLFFFSTFVSFLYFYLIGKDGGSWVS
jgi:hypothetical protein